MLDDFREWLSDNLRYILLGLAVILVVIIAIFAVKLIGGSSSGGAKKETQNTGVTSQTTKDGAETSKEDDEEDESETQAVVVPAAQTDLVKDDAAVLTLVRKHYEAIAAKDVTTLSQIVTPWDNNVEDDLLQKDVIESYSDIATYSKAGLTKGSYIVFAYFKGKVAGFEEGIPSLRRLYLVDDGNGNLKISYNCDADKNVADYITSVIEGEDVQRLIAQVNDEYMTVISANPELKAYLEGLENAAVGETEADAATAGAAAAGTIRTAMYDLNIRQEMSTSCAILGTVPKGFDVTVIADKEDGWTNITFDAGGGAITGFVRTEYLGESQNAPANTAGAAETAADTPAA